MDDGARGRVDDGQGAARGPADRSAHASVEDDDPEGGRAAPASVRTVRTAGGPVSVHVFPAVPVPRGARRPVLVAFHGWTDSGECFAPLAEALGRRWTVLAPDAPAHGGTRWEPAAEYVVADHARGGVAVVDAAIRLAGRRGPVVVLGHSMGALTAARVAAARPGVVRQLVLEDPARTKMRRLRSSAARLAVLERLQGMSDDALRAEISADAPDWPADEYGPWVTSKRQVDLAHVAVPVDWGEPLAALLADVRGPVTLVRGDPARGGIVS
ncbi:MAG: alpha/beta fold hydrolase, partial [Actinobacteria bacterium]|nr:alpha/beta fold hydrolase [Actinomycetota bacterium]